MAYPVTPTNEVDPISRIEGHLGIAVVASGGVVTNAFAHGNLWRGFENFLLGRDANDAITFTQRICGVCPVPHGLTATFAADTVLGYSAGHITFAYNGTDGVPAKAVLIRNLVLSAEFLMSSITHFYHLAAPSYVQGPAIPPWTPYFDNSYYHVGLRSATGSPASPAPGVVPDAAAGTIRVWDAVIISYVRALRIRRLTFEAGALFAGRMPMTSCYVAGGVTNDGTENLAPRIAKFKALIREVGLFIINEYVPIALVLGMLYQTFDSQTYTLGSVAGTSTTMKASNRGVGGGLGRFLAWGAFPNLDDSLTLPGGLKDVATPANNFTVADRAEVVAKFLDGGTNSVKNNLKEDIAFSRYGVSDLDTAAYTGTAAYPGDVARTKPVRANGYTYMKAPRWNHMACEVGPFARLAVAGIYPVNGTSLWASGPLAAAAGIYTNAGALDTRVIASTIVNALVNTGPLLGTNLVTDVQNWILGLKGGLSTMDRLRARALESAVLVQKMVGSISKAGDGSLSFGSDGWIDDPALASTAAGSTCRNLPVPTGTRHGWGGTEAPRGALMHHSTITNGKIVKYQCIVPTTWNGSPQSSVAEGGEHGAIEAACIGAPFDDATGTKASTFAGQTGAVGYINGVEVLRIAQSFDPCIACAVH